MQTLFSLSDGQNKLQQALLSLDSVYFNNLQTLCSLDDRHVKPSSHWTAIILTILSSAAGHLT